MSSSKQSYFPPAGLAHDGWSTEDEASATCFCGTVQLSFLIARQPTQGPGLVDTFVCNCYDCRKITASMFASNFVIADKYLKHLRGQDKLKTFAQSKTIGSGHTMTNHFCSNCGTLMYRVGEGFPGMSILRIGTVDDFSLHETKLRPRREQYVKDRVDWFTGVEGAEKFEAMGYSSKHKL
ncbi:Mss4-like protein [Schizophyllum commune]